MMLGGKTIEYLQKYEITVELLQELFREFAWSIGNQWKTNIFFNTKQEDDNKPKNQYKEFQKCQGFGIMHDHKTHWMKEVINTKNFKSVTGFGIMHDPKTHWLK